MSYYRYKPYAPDEIRKLMELYMERGDLSDRQFCWLHRITEEHLESYLHYREKKQEMFDEHYDELHAYLMGEKRYPPGESKEHLEADTDKINRTLIHHRTWEVEVDHDVKMESLKKVMLAIGALE